MLVLMALMFLTPKSDAQLPPVCDNWDPPLPNKYFSMAISPYTKYEWTPWTDPAVQGWGYSFQDVQDVVNLAAPCTTSVASYSMGVWAGNYNDAWNGTTIFRNVFIARAAANYNAARCEATDGILPEPALTVSLGIYQIRDANPQVQQTEIDNAYKAAADAHQIYAGTVKRLVFTNEYVTDQEKGLYVYNLLRKNRCKAHKRGLKIGARIHTCWAMHKDLPDSVRADPNVQQLTAIITEIAKVSDFIMCNIYPPVPFNSGRIDWAVGNVTYMYNAAKEGFHSVNPKLDVIIGETGWSSKYANFYNTAEYNTPKNLIAFWKAINRWCNDDKVECHMFEAIDEPWKGRSDQGGALPGETTLGLWYMDEHGKYVAKTA